MILMSVPSGERLSGGSLAGDELTRASVRIGEVMSLLDEKEMRWLELSCL